MLASVPRDEHGDSEVTAKKLSELTNLPPAEINDAVSIIVDSRLVEWYQSVGTAPFDFSHVSITTIVRHELQTSQKEK